MSTTKYSLIQCLSLVKITGNCAIVSVRTVYQLVLPSTICLATSSGSCTPFMSNSVTPFMASTQASNGDKQTYQPAQKNPTGQARNHRTRNQIIAQRTFMFFFPFFTDLYSVTVKTKKEITRSIPVKNGLKHYNVGLKARRFRRCSHVIRFCRENGDLFSPVWSTDRMYSTNMVTENSSFQKRLPEWRVLKTPFQLY